jgi:hypothetical protein
LLAQRFRFAIPVGICLLVWNATAADPQIKIEPSGRNLATQQGLSIIAGGDDQMQPVVRECLIRFLRSVALLNPSLGTVTVLEPQLPSVWLSQLPDVQFEPLSEDSAATSYRQCRGILWIDSVQRSDGLLSVTVSHGHKCRRHGSTYRFDRSPDGWRIKEEGASGFVSSQGHCECQ